MIESFPGRKFHELMLIAGLLDNESYIKLAYGLSFIDIYSKLKKKQEITVGSSPADIVSRFEWTRDKLSYKAICDQRESEHTDTRAKMEDLRKNGEKPATFDITPQIEALKELSGGEKAILFTITRIMISRLLYPNVGLIMIDEPLEHLDFKNRRILLDFLFEIQEVGVIDQILIATFEESLSRNYLDLDTTNLIVLPRPARIS